MPSPPKLRESEVCRPKSVRFPPRLQLEGGLDVRARRLDDGLCCLTEDAAVQLHRRRCSFITSGSPL